MTKTTATTATARPAADWMDKGGAEAGVRLAEEAGMPAVTQRDSITGHWGVRVMLKSRAYYFDRTGYLLEWLAKVPAAQPVAPAAPTPTPAAILPPNGTGGAVPMSGTWQPVVAAPPKSRGNTRAYATPTLTLLKMTKHPTDWRLGLSLVLVEAMGAAVPKLSHVRFYVERDQASRFVIVPTSETDPARAAALSSRQRHRQASGLPVAALLSTLDATLLPDKSTAYPATAVVLPGIGPAWIVDLTDPGRHVTARAHKGDR